jgi:monoamine oxidase
VIRGGHMTGGRLSVLARAMRESTQATSSIRYAHTPRASALQTGGAGSLSAVSPSGPGAISRRRLLRMGGTVGVSAALAACTTSSSPTPGGKRNAAAAHGARVVVIGAGLAGTTAAYWLARSGVQVRLFEARDRIGGRCWTAREFAEGQTAEHGGEFIDTRHVHLRRLAAELGLQLDDLWNGGVAGAVSPSWLNGHYFHYAAVNSQLNRISSAVTAQARRIGVIGANGRASDAAYSFGTATAAARQVDELNMREWVDQYVPGVPADVKTFLDQTMSGWYGLDMAGLSALNWIDFLVIPYPGGDERWHVRHGNDQVPTLAAKSLPERATELGSPLQALVKRSDGSYELRFGGSAPSRKVIADHVILTIPWTTLRDVDLDGAGMSSYRMTAIRELGMGTDVKLILQYNRRPAKFSVQGAPWSGTVNYANPNYQTWDSAPTEPGGDGLITVYAGGSGSKAFASPSYHAMAPLDLTAKVVDQINDVVPGTRADFSGKAWLDYWTGDPWTRGSYAAYTPGQMTKYWGYAGIPEGKVHFAGEHTSTYSQGFLNGGVESGERAAIEVLHALGLPVPRAIASLPYSRIPGEHLGVSRSK